MYLVIHAVNSMQNVESFVPFQLVFGITPKHPSMVKENPGQNEVLADFPAQWARHYKMQMAAREGYAASEADDTIRKALKQRIYSDISGVQIWAWVYFKRNPDRYWRGPTKVAMKDRKTLHCGMHGNPLVVNLDDILLHKPYTAEIEIKLLISLAEQQQPPVSQSLQQTKPEVVLQRGTGAPSQEKWETLNLTERDDNDEIQPPAEENQRDATPEVQPGLQSFNQTLLQDIPATSNIIAEDLSFPLQYNLCERDLKQELPCPLPDRSQYHQT